jgi:APA family basic amino acid/polyamine antiporter
MLDYTVDIALFSLASAGYLSYFFPKDLQNTTVLGITAAVLVLWLLVLNVIGIRGSSLFNEALVGIGITIQSIVLVLSLALHFDWNLFLRDLLTLGVNQPQPGIDYVLPNVHLTLQNFIYAATLAMASFIGIESIAQAAEETKKPYRWIPRANKLSILFVLIFTIGLSIAGIGGIGAAGLSGNITNPVTAMVVPIPLVGAYLAPVVAITGFALCYVSTNTGVIGVSRVVYSMGRFKLMPKWFYRVHPTFRTPVRAILIFGIIGAALAFAGDLQLVADLYNFGALLSYIMVNVSLIVLRNREQDTYRAWKIPGDIRLKLGDRHIIIPGVSIIGTLSCTVIWLLVVTFHPAGRLLGMTWLAIGLIGFVLYRKLIAVPIRSKETAKEIKPSGYMMNALALVRTPEDPDAVAEALKRALDPRFDLTLFNVIDPSLAKPGTGEVGHHEHLRRLEAAEREDLKEIADKLKAAGFRCRVRTAIGPLIEVLRQEAESEANDSIVLIKRKAVKGDVEKERIDSAYSVLSRYPGKLMVVRRVEVRGRKR